MFNPDTLFTQSHGEGSFSLYDDIYFKLKSGSSNPLYYPTFHEIDEYEQSHPKEILELKLKYSRHLI